MGAVTFLIRQPVLGIEPGRTATLPKLSHAWQFGKAALTAWLDCGRSCRKAQHSLACTQIMPSIPPLSNLPTWQVQRFFASNVAPAAGQHEQHTGDA
jgi:hypothetical protein